MYRKPQPSAASRQSFWLSEIMNFAGRGFSLFLLCLYPLFVLWRLLCALSCGSLSGKRCMHRLQRCLGERPEGRTGLRVALACVR